MSLKKTILFLLFFATSHFVFCQGITKQNKNKLYALLQSKMQNRSDNSRERVPSEFFILILNTDSTGHIFSKTLYSNSSLKDSSFFALSNLKVEDFQTLCIKELLSYTLIIPIVSLAPQDETDIFTGFFSDCFSRTDYKRKFQFCNKRFLVLDKLLFTVPTTFKE